MNKQEVRIAVMPASECPEWPEAVNRAFQQFVESAEGQGFSVICAVGLNHTTKRPSAQFSPRSSTNPQLADMCEDISEMFRLMARRCRQ